MILKVCNKCGKLIYYPNSYCDKCKLSYLKEKEELLKKSKRKSNANYDKNKRNKEHKAFYNSDEWKMLSERYLQDKRYKCEKCLLKKKTDPSWKVCLATEVHHIKYLSTPEGWNRRLDYTNLMALCHYHHNKIHGRFIKKR